MPGRLTWPRLAIMFLVGACRLGPVVVAQSARGQVGRRVPAVRQVVTQVAAAAREYRQGAEEHLEATRVEEECRGASPSGAGVRPTALPTPSGAEATPADTPVATLADQVHREAAGRMVGRPGACRTGEALREAHPVAGRIPEVDSRHTDRLGPRDLAAGGRRTGGISSWPTGRRRPITSGSRRRPPRWRRTKGGGPR